MMATTSSITMQSLGKIVQRAGCRCENVVFVTMFVAVYRPISTRFGSFFSEVIALSDTLHSSHVRL